MYDIKHEIIQFFSNCNTYEISQITIYFKELNLYFKLCTAMSDDGITDQNM